ncbi:uncharacterized protein CC84DRAFT_1211326 [Paraphaeosphaeria sporulosa]|uniref:Chitin-binding type-1 domain-containing protein n=1 Tax=Paraphaeosphaeria sporulosa TaxID=1460663 RepID=A0A177CWT2_9PLEO|nr:uncharacterized protein CC84DRAFT_1211326 [Paraphaeosphaeria sporulosa]OAG11676.1 hypothetical protein CC84DRAFT_1211326 [Paraphaeosphaeria sporulosa]
MRSTAILASVGTASASAVIPQAIPVLPRTVPQSYDFNLTAFTHSHSRGRVHTLADGQLRLGDGSIPLANFTFTPEIGIVDSKRRGCISTPGPTNQFQCDEGVKPMPDFDISCDNQLLFNSSPHFWACRVNDKGVENIYTEPVPQQLWCVYIQLFAWSSPKISNRTGCKEDKGTDHVPWIFPWDRFYNNSPAVQPNTPEGARQMASYLEDSKHASSNATIGRPKAEHGIQSPDGRCGSPTGFNCFGKIDGPCCSSHGWCGFSASHCGAGCQGDFGICDDESSEKASYGTSTSSKMASKASPISKALNSTSSKAPSKTSSTGKATNSATRTADNNGTYSPAPDCNDPANTEKCGNSYLAYGCPHDLEGTFESPRLMATVSKVDPEKALGNRMDGHIGNAQCSLYNFDVGPGNAGQKCSLVWLFPEERYTDNSTFFVTSPKKTPVMEFWHVRQPASDGMTW